MPRDDELYQKKELQLNKDIRVASDHHAGELRKKDRSLYDQAMIRQDNQEIDQILQGKHLSAEDRSNLEMIRGRNLSSLLVLDEKKSGDSKQMKAVKKSVSAVEVKINAYRLGDPFTEAAIDDILRLYETAIFACKDYLKDKDPSYTKGKERLALVRMNADRLHEEAEAFLVAKELLRTGVIDGMANNGQALLAQAKVYGLTNGNKAPEGEEPSPELPDEQTLKDSGYEASMLYQALSGKEMPSDMIRRLAKSKNKKEQEFAVELTRLFANLRSSLNDFREGKVQAKIFLIGNTMISVHQNTFGQLVMNVGGKRLPLERHTGIIADMLATDVVKNEELYGEKKAKAVILDAIEGIKVRSFGTEKRQILTDYLVKHTRYSVTDFANFEIHDLVFMIRSLFTGRNLYLIDSELSMQWELSENDVVFNKNHGTLINVMESREMLRDTEKQKDQLKDREKKEAQAEKAEQKQEEKREEKQKQKADEKKEDTWTEQEQKVINLMGDVIFSYDSWTADEKRQEPGKRMQLALAKNADALAYIISDIFSLGELNLKRINGMLDKMPLFVLEKQQAEEFRKTVVKALSDAATEIMKTVDSIITEKLGPRPEGFFAGLGYDSKKFAAGGAAKLHLMNAEGLQKGLEVKDEQGNVLFQIDSLKDIIRGLDEKTVEKLAVAEGALDQGVAVASEMIQKSISKYSGELFKSNKKAKEELPNPYAPGLEPEEVKRLKRERYEAGNRMLGDMVKDSMTSGESGQGLFTKLVFENYFKGVDVLDQRSMLASMIRNAKPAGKLEDESEDGIDDDEKELRKEHNEKIKAESMGNYIGGLLKGAGPLFQKMMQGLPQEGLPEELKVAVMDMKSKLAPIPEEIVEAQLASMVKRSHGQVKRINVVKPLGAASVGQTFLCKITRVDGEEEEAAVKLLKPDVTNRMMREKQLMINCARQTDIESRRIENEKRAANHQKLLPEIKWDEKGGMQVTYEGQLERIQEELDLTIEARNVELGKIYDKSVKEGDEKVTSMKLNRLIAPTANSMVLEKAPGETVDSLLERIRKETEQLRDIYKRKVLPGMSGEKKQKIEQKIKEGSEYYGNSVTLADDQGIDENSEEYAKLHPMVVEDQLVAMLAELKKKKAYLDIYARKWTEEGMFKEGFYHGDPHDGNIMVSDDKLTVIDFGNCTKLTEEQQGHVTRMMAAASIGNMEMFRSGLHALLKPEFEELYQQKREELGKEIKTIFKMGDQRSAGARIMVALLKAQELGLEVPSAVYNFSQGQIRLQNTLSNVNHQIEETEKVIAGYTDITGEATDIDLTEDLRDKSIDLYRREDVFPTDKYMKDAADRFFKEKIRYTKDPEAIRKLVSEEFFGFKESFITPLRAQAAKKDSILQSLDFFVSTKQGTDPKVLAMQDWSQALETNFGSVGDVVDSDFQDKVKAMMVSEEPVTDKWIEDRKREIDEKLIRVNAALDSFTELETIQNNVSRKNKGQWKPTEAEQAEFDAACGRFAETYTPIHTEMAEDHELFRKWFAKWGKPNKFKETRPRIERYFMAYPEGKEEFMKAYNAYVEAHEKNLPTTDPDAYAAILKTMKGAYHDVILTRLTEKEKNYSEAADGKKTDFLDVMAEVLEEQLPKLVGRMGIIRSIQMDWKLSRQRKEQKELGME